MLISPLSEILPDRFALTTGEVRAADGTVSGQWDILVYDRMNTPKLFHDPSASVLPIETVAAAISVKSRIDRAAIREATEAAATLRAMPRYERTVGGMQLVVSEPYPAVFLFGFSGLTLPNIREAITEICNGQEPNVLLNGICLHEAGVVMPVDAEGPTPTIKAIERYDFAKTDQGSFGVFVALLYASLMMAPVHAPDLIEYIDLGRMAGHIDES